MEVSEKEKYFTCIGRGHGAPCLPATRRSWERLRKEPWLAEMCAKIENGEDELKHQLPVWTPSCAEFRGNHRAAADALKPLPRLMMDFDEKGHTDEIMQKLGLSSPLTVLLVEESVRRGTHVLVELPAGMAADTAQQLMREATGFEPDVKVKGYERCIYMVPEDHTRYVSDRLFETTDVISNTNLTNFTNQSKEAQHSCDSGHSCSEEKDTKGSDRSVSVSNTNLTNFTNQSREVQHSFDSGHSCSEEKESLCFKSVPYSSIIAEWWRRNGGEPAEGERNVKLHKLAVNLRAICDNNEERLLEVMPRLGLSEAEMKSIIHSACKEPTKGSRMIDQIVSALEMGISPDEIEDAEVAAAETGVKVNVKALPIGLKESLVGVPVSMHMPVLCSVLPIAAAYADQVEVEYCDGNRQRLGLMSIIRGEQASGKSVCKNAVDIWKRQFDEEDALARKREEEWKERKKGRKASEKAPEDPKVLIRMVPVTVSCSTLLKRFKNAQGHTLYSFGEELDTLRKTNGAGSWSSKYDIYRLSFDNGEWGQDYNSDQAESGVVKVAYNWTMLGTNGAMRKCFKSDNIENGLSSRILVAEMPDSSFSKMPKFKHRSAEDEARINEAVTRLRSFSGLIDTPRLRKAIEDWVEQKRVEAAKDIDHVKDTYRKRAAVIGFRCGVIFHLLETPSPLPLKGENGISQGQQVSTPLHSGRGKGEGLSRVSKACIEFALMMADYCLSQQIAAFGEALRSEYVNAQDECQRYGANHSVFDQLAPSFTMEDLRSLKRGYCGESALRNIITRWRRDGWIEKTDSKHWQKVAKQ